MRGRPKQRDQNESKLMDAMITANRLSDGLVVFHDADGGWSEDFHRGAVLSDDGAKAAALARAEQSAADCEVVDPYAIEIESRNGHFVPKALREAIRASGPTIRRDLGKQAQGQAPTIVQRGYVEIVPCIATTNSTTLSSPRASSSSATRSRAASRAN